MMTEDEAREKWCPHVRYRSDRFPEGGINRWTAQGDTQDMPSMCYCIASKCMAWRWAVSPADVKAAERQVVRDSLAIEALDRGPTGYCGLAGPSQ